MKIGMNGSNIKLPADLEPKLPFLLWALSMALILFGFMIAPPSRSAPQSWWTKTLTLLVNLIRVSSLPLMKPVRKMVLEIVDVAVP